MSFSATITLTGGTTNANLGNFSIYAIGSDGSTVRATLATGVSLTGLTQGYPVSGIESTDTIIRVTSDATCKNSVDYILPGATPTPTPTSTGVTLADIGFVANSTDGCSTGVVSRIYLSGADYNTFVANGSIFNGAGGGGPNSCSLIARDQTGTPISNRYHYDSQNTTWKITSGNMTYNSNQC